MAFNSEADFLFYGGAAGGGKTDLGIGLAITKHRKSVIFRRESTLLTDIILRSQDLIGSRGRFNENKGIWRGLPGAKVIELSHCKELKDKENHKGRPRDLYVFDEVQDFLQEQVVFITAWNRSTDPKQRCRVVCTGNPPTTPEGEWIIEFWGPWLDPNHPDFPTPPGELKWYATIEGKVVQVENSDPIYVEGEKEPVQPRSRTFIPAKLEDNAYYRETSYRSVLQGLPEPLRSQLLKGDFSAGRGDHAWQLIPSSHVYQAQKRWTKEGARNKQMTGLGCDVSRGGKAKTVIARLYGFWFDELLKYQGKEDTDSGQKVAALARAALKHDAEINIDVIGVGSSAYDFLVEWGIDVNGINFGEPTDETDKTGRLRMANVRAAAYWAFKEAIDPESKLPIALPPDRELFTELCAPHWSVRGGKIYIESKEEIEKRIGRSTDCADAVVLAWYLGRYEIDSDASALLRAMKTRGTD